MKTTVNPIDPAFRTSASSFDEKSLAKKA